MAHQQQSRPPAPPPEAPLAAPSHGAPTEEGAPAARARIAPAPPVAPTPAGPAGDCACGCHAVVPSEPAAPAPPVPPAPDDEPAGGPLGAAWAIRHAAAELVDRLARGEAADPVALLQATLSARDRLWAIAVRATQQAERTGATRAGLSLDADRFLRAACRRTDREATTLVRAAGVLVHLPVTQRLLEQGLLTAGEIAAIVALAHRRRRQDLALLDRTLAANLDRLADLSADEVVGAVERLLDRQRERLAEAKERRRRRRRFAALRPEADGGGSLYAELGPEQFAVVATALQAAARGLLERADPDEEPSWRRLGRARADALTELCARWLAGEGSGRRARPLVTLVVDGHSLAQLEQGSLWGQLISPTAAGPVQLTPRAVRRILTDADPRLRVVFTDGGEILGVSRPTEHLPAALKVALLARDGAARDPGAHAPLARTDRHHLTPRGQGGPTVLANLLTTSRRFHPALEEAGAWAVTLAPDGTATFTHRATGRTHTTLPRARRELHPPGHPAGPPAGAAPAPHQDGRAPP